MQRHQKTQGLPSKSPKGKRKPEPRGESRKGPQPKKQRDNDRQSDREAIILSEVEKIMESVLEDPPSQDNSKLRAFLRTYIKHFKTDKRELVGVFGRSGAGKSSLINAIIGEKGLLPTGGISACTSVMIKVQENLNNSKYEAEIEFITPEEWEEEVQTMKQLLRDNPEQRDDDEYHEIDEKLSAFYGEEWKDKFPEEPLHSKYFREIKEFLQQQKKTLTCGSAERLSEELIKYTRSASKHGKCKEIKKCFWPLVKCVTVKVPEKDLLQHVTLVDLPGSGDRNKSRDEMWKGIVRDCSTVWIVTEITRAASEKEAWKILKNTCSLIGNGGQCQQIHFICTKSDRFDDSDDDSEDDAHSSIVQRNEEAKEAVIKEFGLLNQVKKHFSDDCFQVFTVSSKEFLKKKYLDPEDTEIPKLQEFLKDLNDCHSETLNYVSRAYGILSLMQGARSTEGAGKKALVCAELEENLSHQLGQVKKAVDNAHKAFETHLTKGVEESKSSCTQKLTSVLYSSDDGRGFHRTLKSVVQKDGIHTTTNGEQINLNETLASSLTDSIDEEFRKTFPNEKKRGSFNGVISTFSLKVDGLIRKNQSLVLQLIFLKMEEEILKTTLNKTIRHYKKAIYSSLTETVKGRMQKCYKEAAKISGTDTLKNMRSTIEEHVRVSKNTMFEEAKGAMLSLLTGLKKEILKTLQDDMTKSIKLSLEADDNSIPDVAAELEKVKQYYKELKRMSEK